MWNKQRFTPNQFLSALILVLFVLAFSGQNVLAQKSEAASRKRTVTTNQTRPQQSESQPQDVSLANELPTQNETNQTKSSSSDENSASLKETFDWLKSKLENYDLEFLEISTYMTKDGIRLNYKFHYSTFRLDGCSLTYDLKINGKKEEESTYPEKYESKFNFKIPLSNLDPLNIKVSGVIKYTNTESARVSPEIWYVDVVNHDSKDKYNPAANFGFFFDDREMAKRVAKAFQNAVKKCGGKVEPF